MNSARPTPASLRRFVAVVVMAIALPVASGFAATAPPGDRAELEAYLERNEAEFLEKLRAYNNEHAVVQSYQTARFVVHSHRVEGVEGDRAWITVQFSAGKRPGNALFQLMWVDGSYQVVGHQTITPGSKTLAAEKTDPPLRSLAETEAYIEQNLAEFTSKLRDYNAAKQIAQHREVFDKVEIDAWRIDRLAGDRAFVAIDFRVGSASQKGPGSALFELKWTGGDLAFVGYEKISTRPKITGGPDPGRDTCIFNYYSPRPCIDVMRKWSEFAALHDLPMDQESAAILQAYKQLDYDRGDELMATVKGLAPPVERSVFALQNEVTAMNLPKPGRETDCAWNPYAPNPCPEALRIFRAFAARHGLEANVASANMFDAYTRGDFKKADVIYALARNLDVPAYGHIPSVAARDLASNWQELHRATLAAAKGGCQLNPHDTRPCDIAHLMPIWREFAARYGLEDTAESGQIFEAYAWGDFATGDTRLAEAMGVPLETLMEASGVPSRDLSIEVYPGWRQMLRDLLVGT